VHSLCCTEPLLPLLLLLLLPLLPAMLLAAWLRPLLLLLPSPVPCTILPALLLLPLLLLLLLVLLLLLLLLLPLLGNPLRSLREGGLLRAVHPVRTATNMSSYTALDSG
jgi:hypothetical protein